jgi:hypothetical protein
MFLASVLAAVLCWNFCWLRFKTCYNVIDNNIATVLFLEDIVDCKILYSIIVSLLVYILMASLIKLF